MLEKNEWMFDDEQLIEEVPNNGEIERISLNTTDSLSEKIMRKTFNYKNRSCLGKFFCCIFCCECPCCINLDPLNEKYYFIKLWNKLTKESNFNESSTLLPFQTLINLFAHKYVIDDLKKIRLNPNLILLEQGQRNDLEFYIPQLCNFNLFGGQEQVAQFFFFLCNACYASFFFAHRVYWFMRSFENVDCLSKIEHDLKFLNSIFQSENKENKYYLTNLFVAGSQKYIDYLDNKNYLLFYKKKLELIDKNSIFSEKENNYYNNIINGKKIINNYSEYMCKKALGLDKPSNNINNKNDINISEKDLKENEEKPQISSKNFFINNYSFYTENPVDYAPTEGILNEGYVIINSNEDILDMNEIDDVNLLSFHSVISFFDDLCRIGRNLRGKDSSEFKEIIVKEITKINKNLPANVYLPFLSDNTRNYIIVHIPVTELKIFKTKERVPFMLVFEMIRLDEIIYQIQKENSISIFNLDSNINISEDDEDNIKINKNKDDGKLLVNEFFDDEFNNKKEFKKVNAEIVSKKEVSKEKKKNKKEKKNKKTKDKNKENNEDENLLKIIKESDNELSKQISINLLEEEKKKMENEKNAKNLETPTATKKKVSNELKFSNQKSGLITEYQFSKYQKSFENISMNQKRKRSHSFGSLDDEKKSIKKFIIEKKEDEDVNTNSSNKAKIDNTEEQKFVINIQENLNIGENLLTINKENKNLLENKDNINNNILNDKKNIEDDISSEQSDEETKNQIITTNNDKINPEKGGIDIKKIFGEKLKYQKERLKLNSPFKNFKTFNIFKAIIKAGEDLKQEQFATQLISVFREIFSQNGVDCWLSSYEIISTGQDCGLVEMISNSLSMDQIKQKTGLSLKQFYLEYFGGEKSKKYQIAVKNFIKSLAGYSLVCYFLQIKDRHNGNILIDSKGHLIHIDFGFMLSNAPGKGIKFEKAPFKITDEMLELIGGINSDNFKEYRKKLFKGYFAIYDHFEKIQKLAEFMFIGQGKYFPCFVEKEIALANLKERLRPRNNMSKQQKLQYIDDLLSKSIDNWTTTYYDKFQYYIQGIFY